jgi:hypothetical protein
MSRSAEVVHGSEDVCVKRLARSSYHVRAERVFTVDEGIMIAASN